MGVNMEISEKLLVEQAWALQVKLARQLEINCYPFSKRQMVRFVPTTKKENLHEVHERAYSRYHRRLKRFWA